jgi:tripartite-type tricarboxylate transporter receptor subunit TctC
MAAEQQMRRREFVAGLGSLVLGARAARAQSYPTRLIKLILPFTAGSPNDVLARFFAPHLSRRIAQPVIVENRPGGGTSVGARAVLASEPDGYTLMFSNTPTHVIAALGHGGASYDPVKDFAPVAIVGASSLVMVIAPAVPAGSVQEFVAYAKSHPGKLNFGFGQGTLPHLAGELFKLVTGTDILSVPYRGGAQAVSDMLGGRIEMNFGSGSTLFPFVREGRLRALAVTSTTRSPIQPELSTMIEAGLPEMTVITNYGILGPAGLPAEVMAKLNAAVDDCLAPVDVRAVMRKIGFDPVGGSAQDFAAAIASDLRRWAPIAKATGFQLE